MIPIITLFSGMSPSIHPIDWSPIWSIIYHGGKVIPALIFYLWLLVTALRSPRRKDFMESITDTFRIAWNGLKTGKNPTVEGGILIQRESKLEENATISIHQC
jgi:hypothetical protein